MTINQAIRHATATVRMYPFGRSYILEIYCPKLNAWTDSRQMSFHAARACLTERRHAVALVALGWDYWDAECAAFDCAGSLRDRVKASLKN